MSAIASLVNTIIESVDLGSIPRNEAVVEYTDQLETGDCSCLYKFLWHEGKRKLAMQVKGYLKDQPA